MADLNDRQAALYAIDVLKRNYPSSCFEDLCKAVDLAIKALSAQPERKKGRWLHKWSGDGSVWLEQNCSECGVTFEEEPINYNFCPHCGADMREEKHEAN